MDGKELEQMECYVDVVCKLISTTPSLKEFFGIMGSIAANDVEELQEPKRMFCHAFIVGYAKAMFDIQSGRLDINTLIIEREPSENKESYNPLLRRNKAPGDGKTG